MTEPPPSLQYDRDARFKRKLEDHAYAKQSAVAFRRHALKDRRENIKLRAALDAQSQLLAEAMEALEQMTEDCANLVNIIEGKAEQEWDYEYQRERITNARTVRTKLKAASEDG